MPKKSSQTKEAIQQKVLHRLSRIEGQLKGIRRMVEEKNQCLDIVTQVLAVRSAISVLGVELLKGDMLCHPNEKHMIDEAFLQRLFLLN